jgi:putative ABC transport system permease protein
MSPRWKKVLQDLFSNKTRTILTMLSIAVGVFAVGVVTIIGGITLPDMEADFNSASPHSGRIFTQPFDDTLLASVRSVPGVDNAEGRSTITGQLVQQNGQKVAMFVSGIPALNKMQMDTLKFSGPQINLSKKDVLLDKSTSSLGFTPGDLISIELPNGKIKTLNFKGYVHDVTGIPYGFTGQIPAYVNTETIEWLGGSNQYTLLLYSVKENKQDLTHVSNIGNGRHPCG